VQSLPTVVRLGHVGHDHHTALYVAMDNADMYRDRSSVDVNVVEDRKFYEFRRAGRKTADVEIVRVGGGSEMPTALAQGVIDVGFGGVAPVLAAIDSGAPIKLIAPLHYKGDMFVVRPDFEAETWEEFVAVAKAAEQPLRIGYKNPVACAKVIFEEALRHEGIAFGGDPSQEGLKVHMVNVKGGGKLNVALSGGLIDGYVGNNPFPSIAVAQGLGRVVCDLEELPPGTFRDHPCCCIAARTEAIREKPEAITDLLVLFLQASDTIEQDLDTAVAAAVRWIGTSEAVERMSIPTSGYSMETSLRWYDTMAQWIEAMQGLGIFRQELKDKSAEEAAKIAYDFSLLEKARQRLADQ
jgi:NitT/TauT family transport system substrate-binding protein